MFSLAPLWKNVFKPQEYLSDDYPAFNAIHQEYEVKSDLLIFVNL